MAKMKQHEVWINSFGEAEGDLIDDVIADILKIMMYRGSMPEEGILRVALAKLLKHKPTITRSDIFRIIQATLDCKDIDVLITRYSVIFKSMGWEVRNG